MKKFKVQLYFTSAAVVEVEAEDESAAIAYAEDHGDEIAEENEEQLRESRTVDYGQTDVLEDDENWIKATPFKSEND